MFTYVDLTKTAEPIKNKEMSCLNELSHRMDQFFNLATTAHAYLCESSQTKHTHWNMFKAGQISSQVSHQTHSPRH